MIVSVIIPIYNAENYLKRCVDSVLNQSVNFLQVLLIDDGSTDNSGAICDFYAKQDNRVKVCHIKNGGVSRARNKGIELAEGKYLLMLDSDDWLASNTLEILMDVQSKNNADCVIFGFNQTSGNIWAPENNLVYDSIDSLKKDFTYHINTELLSSSVNKLYKKELIKKMYPEDMAFGEDLLFSLNYLEECNNVVFIKNPLYQHDVYNNTSLTHTFNIKRFHDIEAIQKRILEFATDKSDKFLYKKYVADCIRIIRRFLICDKTYNGKRVMLNDWLGNSYFKKIKLNQYELIWQNRLLLFFIQYRLFLLAYLLVNWKRILKLS